MIHRNSIIALDIGPKEIRLIAGETGKTAVVPLEKAVSKDCVIVDPQKAAGAIKSLFKSRGIRGKNVGAVVWGRGVVLRLMRVPRLGEEEINRIIKEESSKYMVFAGSDLLTGFHTIEEINEDGNRRLKILSVAVKREIIDSYVETMKLAGLNLCCIEASSAAIARALFLNNTSLLKGVVVLAAVEYDNATIFVFKDGKIHYLHKADSINELHSEMESITAYCRDEFKENFEVREVVSSDLGELTAAKGLTLRDTAKARFPIDINLLPVEEIKTAKFNSQFFMFLRVLALAAMGVVLYFFFLYFQTWNTSRSIDALRKSLKKPTPVLNELLDIEKKTKMYNIELNEQNKIIEKAKEENWAGILKEIKRIIPKNAYLSSLISNEKGVILFKGEALDQSAVFDFVRSLKESRFFENVKLEESKDKENQNEGYTYFIIKCQISKIKEKFKE